MIDYPIKDPNNQTYPRRLMTAVDLFLNALVGGRLDETISSRCSKGAIAGNKLAKLMVGIFNIFQPNHFEMAPEGDEARAQEVIADLEKNTGTTPDIQK